MPTDRLYIAYKTIVTKEITRFMRIWTQTILPAAISMALYFIIFGNLIGPRIGVMGGFSYMEFIAPGIIMMSIINNAYSNVSSSFFGARFQRHIEEMIIAPVPNWVILAGYISGGVLRGPDCRPGGDGHSVVLHRHALGLQPPDSHKYCRPHFHPVFPGWFS